MSGKLKPCPFCGSEDIAFDFGIGRGVAYAYCCNCGAESMTRASASEAAKDWNRRVIDTDTLREVVAEIEEADVDGTGDWAERIRKAVGL